MPTVLIVDDDLKLLKMLQRTLVYENLSVLTAANGQEALPIVRGQCPDLLILDWMMPKMDGLAVIRQLRAEGNSIPVMMLTARDAVESRVDGLESGADDYLVKPFAPAELVARVHALLRRIETRPENQAVSYAGVSLAPGTHPARCLSAARSWMRYGVTISRAMITCSRSISATCVKSSKPAAPRASSTPCAGWATSSARNNARL